VRMPIVSNAETFTFLSSAKIPAESCSFVEIDHLLTPLIYYSDDQAPVLSPGTNDRVIYFSSASKTVQVP